MNWKSIEKDGAPPFDTLVLVRAKDEQFGFYKYAIAYNECYRPNMCMVQVIELDESLKDKLPIYVNVPFHPEEWLEIN